MLEVTRNFYTGSLSARRAWIEIVISAMTGQISVVALRKESVDRNKIRIAPINSVSRSLSARRAWIEIAVMRQNPGKHYGRSPQGERG